MNGRGPGPGAQLALRYTTRQVAALTRGLLPHDPGTRQLDLPLIAPIGGELVATIDSGPGAGAPGRWRRLRRRPGP